MTAADYNFSLTRTKIIEAALRKVGGFYEGEVLSGYKEQTAQETLNTLVKSWQNKGTFLWTEKVVLTSTVAGTVSYAFPLDSNSAPFLSIDKAFIRDDSQDLPLEMVSWEKYQDVYRKDTTGFPSVISCDYANRLFYLSTVPDAVYGIYIYGLVLLKDLDSESAVGDIKTNWLDALIFGLARKLSFEYPMTQGEKEDIALEAERTFMEAKRSERKSMSDNSCVSSAFSRSVFK